MSEPFIGEIRLFANNYAPRGWSYCEGQILQISTNTALFSLLGNAYGGNGTTTFALPDYRGRVPIHVNGAHPLGQKGGTDNHTLTQAEMPMHTHQVSAASASSVVSPSGAVWGGQLNGFAPAESLVSMDELAIGASGGSQPHSNMQPYLALRYAIALEGIYPSRN